MIIKTPDTEDYWSCLIRRGMLHSETETIEHWALAPQQSLTLGNQGVHEAVIILSGHADVEGRKLETGSVLLAPAQQHATLRAETETILLSVRTYPESVTRNLPPRIPELPESERAI
ncbi:MULTISPECIES: hypothetical protein [Paenarthrobacter]|jgi:hypothetical protein|uniref:hypothetical protein n=1 Tax=Paenarthrobacter TaxID=1742992 RepID=UPI00236665BE|nr:MULTISPECIES: hypothetical protein [Paenarthrobacter]MDD7835614.1 hypothetical protein [Paenarthrobacter sp. AB444]MDP9936278.1 hypothetical protein [Paenarthrobacter nicotinovorans]